MERKDFLKGLGLFGLGAVIVPVLSQCSSNDSATTTATTDPVETDPISGCSVSPTETEGPFPTHTPSNLIITDIRSDREGIDLGITISLQNANSNNAVLQNAIVDIWHCDKDGNYSEYGGTQMQSTNYTDVHFLRGRQISDTEGKVYFTSIFPGWYSGRATHIHVHVYNTAGNSLLVTQIAFPEASNSAVVTVNASTENGYTKGMSGYTYNANDNVFADSVDCELATISGSIAAGYTLESTIRVSA